MTFILYLIIAQLCACLWASFLYYKFRTHMDRTSNLSDKTWSLEMRMDETDVDIKAMNKRIDSVQSKVNKLT